MRRLIPVEIVAISLVLILLAGWPAGALTNTSQARTGDGTVTLTTYVNFNQGTCSNGSTKFQVTSVSTKFTRTITNRKVPTSHLLAQESGRRCDGSSLNVAREGSWSPVFGCGGRCGANTTEALGISVSFPYYRKSASGCDICWLGGSGDGHVRTGSGGVVAPNPICARVGISAEAFMPPCPDSN